MNIRFIAALAMVALQIGAAHAGEANNPAAVETSAGTGIYHTACYSPTFRLLESCPSTLGLASTSAHRSVAVEVAAAPEVLGPAKGSSRR